jgi:hypothetical protein
MTFFVARKDFPSEESFSPSLLEFEIWVAAAGRGGSLWSFFTTE